MRPLAMASTTAWRAWRRGRIAGWPARRITSSGVSRGGKLALGEGETAAGDILTRLIRESSSFLILFSPAAGEGFTSSLRGISSTTGSLGESLCFFICRLVGGRGGGLGGGAGRGIGGSVGCLPAFMGRGIGVLLKGVGKAGRGIGVFGLCGAGRGSMEGGAGNSSCTGGGAELVAHASCRRLGHPHARRPPRPRRGGT